MAAMTDAATPPTPPSPPSPPSNEPSTSQNLGERIEARAEAFGREMEAAGQRLAKDPTVVQVADTAGRAWGLILLLVGAWFLADVTLGYDMPAIPWRELWPLGLVFLGLVVIFRGMTRRA